MTEGIATAKNEKKRREKQGRQNRKREKRKLIKQLLAYACIYINCVIFIIYYGYDNLVH